MSAGIDTGRPPKRLLGASLWGAQGLLFLSFVWAGIMKAFTPISQLALMWAWTADLPEWSVRALGMIDIAGGVGVLLPAITRIRPGLTVLTALGCVALQICALLFHLLRGEVAAIPVNIIFLALAAFIAWGRSKAPIERR